MSGRAKHILQTAQVIALAGLLCAIALGGSRRFAPACCAAAILLRITGNSGADAESLRKRRFYACLGALSGMAGCLALSFTGIIKTKPLNAVKALILALVMCALFAALLVTRRKPKK